MRPIYKFLEVDNYQAVSDQVYEYVINHTDILKTKLPIFYTDVNILHMLKNVPLLTTFLEQRFLTPTLISVVVVAPDDIPYIHVDYIDPFVRILWPVKHCKGSKTKFYDIPKEYLKLNSDPRGATNTYYDITEDRDWPILDEVELIQPIVFDASFAHAVHPALDATERRISFTIGFDKDLPISKSVKAWFGFQR
jgi:hypothetical protein